LFFPHLPPISGAMIRKYVAKPGGMEKMGIKCEQERGLRFDATWSFLNHGKHYKLTGRTPGKGEQTKWVRRNLWQIRGKCRGRRSTMTEQSHYLQVTGRWREERPGVRVEKQEDNPKKKKNTKRTSHDRQHVANQKKTLR